MTVGPLILELLIVLIAAIIVLHHYGNISKQNKLVTVSTLVSWYFSMIIVFILPLDVSSVSIYEKITYLCTYIEGDTISLI